MVQLGPQESGRGYHRHIRRDFKSTCHPGIYVSQDFFSIPFNDQTITARNGELASERTRCRQERTDAFHRVRIRTKLNHRVRDGHLSQVPTIRERLILDNRYRFRDGHGFNTL